MSISNLLSLQEIFDKRIFRIPDFQRGYSWGKSQLEDLWDDINYLDVNKTHYMGLLTVNKINEDTKNRLLYFDSWLLDNGHSAYYVIDGQQRLTTLIILLNEILLSLNDNEKICGQLKEYWIHYFLYCKQNELTSYFFGYEIDNPSEEYFKTKILEQKSITNQGEETLYTANLKFAKEYFANKLKNLDFNKKEIILEKVINHLKFNYYEIDDSLDIYVTFETMNNRGKNLSYLELLKNRLIYLSTLLPEVDDCAKEQMRNDINIVWKTIYEYLGKNTEKPLNDDDFLYNHWIMYFKYDRSKSEVYADFLLKEKFTSKNVLSKEISYEDIHKYIESLKESVEQWYYIHNITKFNRPENIKIWLSKLNRLGMRAFIPLIMAVFIKEQDDELILEFLQACERFNFLVFFISNRFSNTQNSNFYRKAKEYYKDEITLKKVIEEINILIDNDNDDSWVDLERFKSHIKDLFMKKNKDGFYSWKGLKYFLYEYELSLQEEAKGNTKISWEDFDKGKKEQTIEHIYPQTANDNYWKEKFSNIKTRKEKDLYLHSLGNLLLLSRSKNAQLQNNDFKTKKGSKSKSGNGYINGSYSEIEVARNRDWTPGKIEERGKKMLQFMEKRWNFEFGSVQMKKEILFPKK
jgi:uncharacterized protein with ParB-like and HNH nuclease domain